ncbi:PucR family transcriptional regulator [Alicyclobacillus acidiphilus]|uniref:PucR family transcriptional regulator n=1 Tax=Alicyclobacillus acidiphilus TaxID=182455 RepID=UPI00082D8BB0|nr:helix-turn-helix domain-containing protein [Alicyclobacillus acidiphilus]
MADHSMLCPRNGHGKDGVQDQMYFSAVRRGQELRKNLDREVLQLHHRFPSISFVLEDRYGVAIRSVGDIERDRARFSWAEKPLLWNDREYGRIRYLGQLDKFEYADMSTIVMNLSEFEHWVQTECERRGEKVQKLLADGVTPEMEWLLKLCGLTDYPGYTLVAMELVSATDKFLYMDLLRTFMLARIWGYRDTLDFVAYRPGGLICIFPGMDEEQWGRSLDTWLSEWRAYQSRVHVEQTMEVRACIATVDHMKRLDQAVRKVDSTLQFADRWNLKGVIRSRSNPTMTYMLSNLPEDKVYEFVHRTLGPILLPEHAELLHTLRVYLYLDQNVTETAKALYVHRNTLLYRIRHIEELIGIQLRHTDQLSSVWFAIEGLEMLVSAGWAFRGGVLSNFKK